MRVLDAPVGPNSVNVSDNTVNVADAVNDATVKVGDHNTFSGHAEVTGNFTVSGNNVNVKLIDFDKLKDVARTGFSFVPIVGPAVDCYDAVKQENSMKAALYVGLACLDIVTFGVCSKAHNVFKVAKCANTLTKAARIPIVYSGVSRVGIAVDQCIKHDK